MYITYMLPWMYACLFAFPTLLLHMSYTLHMPGNPSPAPLGNSCNSLYSTAENSRRIKLRLEGSGSWGGKSTLEK